jgi:hypothetical protein
LNGANYGDWTFNMRLYLESLDLFGHADGSIEVEQVKQEFKIASKKAWGQLYKTFNYPFCSLMVVNFEIGVSDWSICFYTTGPRTYVCLVIEPDHEIHVRNTTNAKEACDALKSLFATVSISQISPL